MFKVIGSLLGLRFAGLQGLVLGLLGGYLADEFLGYLSRRIQSHFYTSKARRHFLQSVFGVFGEFAKVDGSLKDHESQFIEGLVQKAFKLSSSEQRLARAYVSRAKGNAKEFFKHSSILQQHAPPPVLESILHMLLHLGEADGELHPIEEDLLQTAAASFGFPLFVLEARRRPTTHRPIHSREDSLEKSYSILQCSKNASDAEVKKQYRNLVKDYHPDTVAAKELPEDFIQFANDKFRHIQSAYETIKQARGF